MDQSSCIMTIIRIVFVSSILVPFTFHLSSRDIVLTRETFLPDCDFHACILLITVIIKTNSISIISYFMMFRIRVNQRIFEILVLVSGRERDEHLYPCKIDEFLMSRTSSNTVFFSWEGKKSCSRFPASVG